MAHIGVFYPLHFRRDLSLNAPLNNVGWAASYTGRLLGCTGTVGTPLNGIDDWLFLPTFAPGTAHLIADTAARVLGGRTIKLRLAGDIIGDPQHWKVSLQVVQNAATVLFSVVLIDEVIEDYSFFFTRDESGVEVQTPGVCTLIVPWLQGANIVRKPWH